MIRIAVSLMLAVVLGWVTPTPAAEPYDNVAVPPGSYLSAYPLYSRADRLMDGNGNRTADPDAELSQVTFKYNYYDKTLLPHTVVFCALLPVGCLELFGDRACGIGDLSLVGGYWFVDDPRAQTWFGARFQAIAPIGDYDANSKANLGGNVWKFRPTLFYAKRAGNVQVELTGKYSIYTRNDDTGAQQGNDVIAETYAGYFVLPDLLVGGHFNATFGDDRTVNGMTVPDSGVRVLQAGLSVFRNFGNGFSALAEALADFGVRNSTEGYTLQMRLSWKL